MRLRLYIVLAVGPLCLASIAQAGQGTGGTVERSHVERFASLRERAEREEAEATARLQATPGDVQALSERGAARLALGKLDGALADFRQASAKDPKQPDLLTSTGYVLARLNRAKEATAAFDQALALDPENFYANYNLGRLMLRSGADPKQAAAHLERAIASRPDDVNIRFDLLTAYRLAGDATAANAQLRYLKEKRPRDPRILYAEGLLAVDRGDLETGVERFKAVLEAEPRLVGAWDDLALAYIRLGKWSDAEPILRRAADANPEAFDPRYMHSLALFNSGRTSEAEAGARILVQRFPDQAAARILLGITRAANGAAPAELVDLFSKAVAIDPKSFDAQFYLGRALFSSHNRPAAIQALTEAVAIKPDHVQARFFLATLLEDERLTDQAVAQYEELSRRAPDSPEGFVGLGAVLVNRGDYDAALAALTRAVALKPDMYEAQYSLGRALVRAGRVEEGVEALTRATVLEPSRAEAHYQLGLALRKLGRTDDAAREFQTVDRLNTEFRTNSTGMGEPVQAPNP